MNCICLKTDQGVLWDKHQIPAGRNEQSLNLLSYFTSFSFFCHSLLSLPSHTILFDFIGASECGSVKPSWGWYWAQCYFHSLLVPPFNTSLLVCGCKWNPAWWGAMNDNVTLASGNIKWVFEDIIILKSYISNNEMLRFCLAVHIYVFMIHNFMMTQQ